MPGFGTTLHPHQCGILAAACTPMWRASHRDDGQCSSDSHWNTFFPVFLLVAGVLVLVIILRYYVLAFGFTNPSICQILICTLHLLLNACFKHSGAGARVLTSNFGAFHAYIVCYT